MPTPNEELVDRAIQHEVRLRGYSVTVLRRIMTVLNKADRDIQIRLLTALRDQNLSDLTLERLDAILVGIREMNRVASRAAESRLNDEIRRITQYEVRWQAATVEDAIPDELTSKIAVTTPAWEQVHAAAMARPFNGRLLTEWVSGLEEGRFTRLRDVLRTGIIEGATVDQMVSRVRGTRAQGYKDGVLEASRRGAEAMVRTAVTHVANFARQKVYEDNDDIIKSVRWVSTLDARTSAICRARDGKIYPVGSGPRPPAHINCRSTTAPVLKSWKELGIDAEELGPATRASMNGQVPAEETYQSWLKRQPRPFIEEVLGVTKARLFIEGQLPLDRFVDRLGNELTLEQLRARDLEAFRRAGL